MEFLRRERGRTPFRAGRVSVAVAMLIIALLPIVFVGERAYEAARESRARIAGERHEVAYALALASVLEDLQRARASAEFPSVATERLPALTARLREDLDSFAASGFSREVPVACGKTWNGWRGDLERWLRAPQSSAIDGIAHRGACYAFTNVFDGKLSNDPDSNVQLLASVFAVFVPALDYRIGATSSLLYRDGDGGYDRAEVLSIARMVAGATRQQNNIDSFIDDNLTRDEPDLAKRLGAEKRRPSRIEAAFETAVDGILTASVVTPAAIRENERNGLAAIDAYSPFSRAGLATIDDLLRAQDRAAVGHIRLLAVSVVVVIIVLPGLVLLALRILAKRQEASLERVRLERDALAAHIARTEAERSLSLTEGQLRVVFETSDIAIAMLDGSRQLVQSNAAFLDFTSTMRELPEVLRSQAEPLFVGPRPRIRSELALTARTGPLTERWIRISLAGVYEGSRCRYAIATLTDVTDQKAKEASLRYDALHDGLTGLANRTAFEEALDAACADESEAFSLLFVDLDRFKPVNDAFGHATGDAVLVAVAGRLRALFASTDVVARLGGDEFAVLARGVGERTDAIALADRLCDAIERPYSVPEHIVDLSASVGIFVAGGDERDAIRIVARADAAMYRAKVLGLRYAVAAAASPA